MAIGKITISNNTTQTLQFRIRGPASGTPPVASGAVQPDLPRGVVVSGYDMYQAQFFPAGSGQIYVSPIVGFDSQVEFIVSSDSGTASDD